jgi:RNA-binding protein Tab2/Atab2
MLQGRIFGETFPLAAAGAGGLSTDALVPGIAVFSRRAEALAAWTSGVELASVSADTDRACLILETGVNERFRCCICAMCTMLEGVQEQQHFCGTAN